VLRGRSFRAAFSSIMAPKILSSTSRILSGLKRPITKTLDPQQFVRHRSIIVNVDQVTEIFREGQSEGSVVLKTGQRLRMSKAGQQGLLSVGRR
jgi:DNA-binding LytR/AlgR family response regulator